MSTIPSAAKHAAALAKLHESAVETLGRGFEPGTIIAAGRPYQAEIWKHDTERANLIPGGLDLPERIVFTISKRLLAAAFEQGVVIEWKELGRRYKIERTEQERANVTSWQFEAKRAPGGED